MKLSTFFFCLFITLYHLHLYIDCANNSSVHLSNKQLKNMASQKIIFLVSFLLISLVTMKGDASVADVVDVGEESVSAASPPQNQCRDGSDDCSGYRCRGGMPFCVNGFCSCW